MQLTLPQAATAMHGTYVAGGASPSPLSSTSQIGQWQPATSDGLIRGVTIDSRQVVPGDLFFALAGTQCDGHAFAADALARGAAGVVISQSHAGCIEGPQIVVSDVGAALRALAGWYRAQVDPLVIGITGSVGKTTTRELVYAVLGQQFRGMRSPESYNNHLGVPLSLLKIPPECEFAVLELGASAIGEIAPLAQLCRPEIGLITAIGKAHLKGFGSQAGIVQGKGELLEALPSSGFAVLPGDDAWCPTLAAKAPCPVIRVGQQDHHDLQATQVQFSQRGLQFVVDHQLYTLPLWGRHFLDCALLAIAVGREVGVTSSQMAAALAEGVPVARRCQRRQIGSLQILDDSYNASPTSMQAGITLLSEFPGAGRRIAVLGDMLDLGDATHVEHQSLAPLLAHAGIDGVVLTGAAMTACAASLLSVGYPVHRLAVCPDLATVQLTLDCWLQPGDTVLLKGSRGMQLDRIVDWLEQRMNGELSAEAAGPGSGEPLTWQSAAA